MCIKEIKYYYLTYLIKYYYDSKGETCGYYHVYIQQT